MRWQDPRWCSARRRAQQTWPRAERGAKFVGASSRALPKSFFAALSAFAKRSQTLERPHPVSMPVRPVRLEGVVADRGDAQQLERRWRVAGRGAGGHAAEEIG